MRGISIGPIFAAPLRWSSLLRLSRQARTLRAKRQLASTCQSWIWTLVCKNMPPQKRSSMVRIQRIHIINIGCLGSGSGVNIIHFLWILLFQNMLILGSETYLIRRGTSGGVIQNRFCEKWMRESRFGDKNDFWDFGVDNSIQSIDK